MSAFPWIDQSDVEVIWCIERPVNHKYTVSETDHQAKILDHLKAVGFDATKVVVATTSGGSDIIAISPCGQGWRIEVKREDGILSALQLAKLEKAHKNHAVVMCVYGYNDYKAKYALLVKRV